MHDVVATETPSPIKSVSLCAGSRARLDHHTLVADGIDSLVTGAAGR
jgi:hypothetical protein